MKTEKTNEKISEERKKEWNNKTDKLKEILRIIYQSLHISMYAIAFEHNSLDKYQTSI